MRPFVREWLGRKFRDAMRWGKIPRPKGPPDPAPFPPGTPFDLATTLDYPRPFCHGETKGLGWPLLQGTASNPADRPVDQRFVESYGRFPICWVYDYPCMQFRRDVPMLMKAYNPKCHIMWFQAMLIRIYQQYGDTTSLWRLRGDDAQIPTDCRFYVPPDMTNPFTGLPAGPNVTFPDFTPAGPTGGCFADYSRYVDAMIADWQAQGGGADPGEGFHIDWADSQLNVQAGVNFDLTRTPYSTVAEMNAALKAAFKKYVSFLNTLTGGRKHVVPNGGTDGGNNGDALDVCGGRFIEGYSQEPFTPFYGWANFDDMMASPIFARFRGPGIDGGGTLFLKAENNDRNASNYFYSADYNRLARFIMGLSCLVGGYGVVNGDAPNPDYDFVNKPPPPFSADRWADEYSVTNGVHDETWHGTGYLGRPIEVAYKDAGGLWVRRFQRGIALVNGLRSFEGSRSITLEKPYKRIQGLHDTTVNDGATVTSVTIPGHDGRILLTT